MHSDDELVPQGTEHVDWSVEPDGLVLVPYGTEFVATPAVVEVVAPAKNPQGGRPPAFTAEKQAEYLAEIRDGAGRDLAAHNVGVAPNTVRSHRARFPEYEAEIIAAESVRNQKAVNALFANVMGGNVTAQIFWVTNRIPDEWQDKRGPRVLQQLNAGPSVEWSLAEARAEAHAVLDELERKRLQKTHDRVEAEAAIEADSREVDGG